MTKTKSTMPCMIVRGKAYHCIRCNETLRVEFERGAILTSLSSYKVIKNQDDLERTYGDPARYPHKNGRYIHCLMACEKCYPKIVQDSGYDEKATDRLMECRGQLWELEFDLVEKIDRWVNQAYVLWPKELGDEDLETIDTEAYWRTLGSWMFRFRFMRKRLILKFLNIARIPILMAFHDWLLKNKEIKGHCDDYWSKAESVVSEMDVLVKGYGGIQFMPMNVKLAENLNPYLETENSARRPVVETPDRVVRVVYRLQTGHITTMLSFSHPYDMELVLDDQVLGELYCNLFERYC